MNFQKKLMSIGLLLITLIVIGCSSSPKTYTSILPVSSEVECLEGIQGESNHYLAWGIGWDNASAETDAMKAAVMAALAKGSQSSGSNCASLMNGDEYSSSSEYIKKFFSGDKWREYVQNTSQGRIDPDKRLRLPDDRIKIGVDVVVNIKRLREDLERDGIIKSMRIGR